MKIVKAEGFVARLIGWLGRRKALADEALWLVPCRGVHTLGMRFPIDLVFLDRSGRVLRIDEAVKPWRCRWHRSAHSVVELAAGAAVASGVTLGTRLRHTRGVEWIALNSPAPMTLLPAVLALLIGAQADNSQAGAPLLEELPAPVPVAIEFQTEWKADAEQLIDDPPITAPIGAPAVLSALASTTGMRASLGAIRLVRPLAPETIARLLDEADSLYRARHWAQALEAYRGLIELDPRNRTAWLRLGNLHHLRNQLGSAASAYRKAAQAPAAGSVEPIAGDEAAVRGKALANLAAVNIELARESLNELQTMRLPADSAAAGLRDSAAADWRQVEQSARALDGMGVSPHAGSAAGTGASSAFGGAGGSGGSGATATSGAGAGPGASSAPADRSSSGRSMARSPAPGQGPRATVEYLRDGPSAGSSWAPRERPVPAR